MRFPEKRKTIMARSIALGHCVCNPKLKCPCPSLINENLCPCAGERRDPPKGPVRLTEYVRKVGCASKINHRDLHTVLAQLPTFDDPHVILGVAAGDDAGVYDIGGDYNIVQTVDVFSPVIDDAYTFGQICAANSVSDIYAMGGRPVCALSIIGFPIEDLPHEVMAEILRGGIETLREANVSVIGGHSINDEEIKGGFAVTGLINGGGSVTVSGARPGDRLVLTKPIGTGVIAFANQIARASEDALKLIGQIMAGLNKDAAELMIAHGAHACTDVTGFSLLGHLTEMTRHSGVSARIDTATIPFLAEAIGGARQGIIPGAIERNKEAFSQGISTDGEEDALLNLLYDAQTSGGLLIALPEEGVGPFIKAMRSRGHEAVSEIGTIVEPEESLIHVTLNESTNLVGVYQEIPPKEKPEPIQPSAEPLACCENPPSAEVKKSVTDSASKPSLSMALGSPSAEQTASSEAFKQFMKSVNTPGSLDARMKRLLNVALATAQRCEQCLQIHIEHALSEGISRGEIDEAAWLGISFAGAPAKLFYEETWRELDRKDKS